MDMSSWLQELEAIQTALSDKREKLNELMRFKTYYSAAGKFTPAEAAELHGGWETVQSGYNWPPADGDRAFYMSCNFLDELAGIGLKGSEAYIEIFSPIGLKVYINGDKRYDVEYWADTCLVPLPLSLDLQGGEGFEIMIQAQKGDGFGLFFGAELKITAVDEWIFQLDTLAEELGFVRFLMENGDIAAAEAAFFIQEAVNLFKPEALETNQWEQIESMVASIRSQLSRFHSAAKQYKVYLAGHAHIDMNWLWPWRETEDLIRRDFESIDHLMEEFPDLCFSHSQAATYKAMEEKFPELWEKVRKRIAEGRWEVTANTWVEGDLNMAGYETMARQILQAKTYVRSRLGTEPEVFWEPDTFGHPATMPQILSHAGIKYYYHFRKSNGNPIYWWEGTTGTRVLVFHDRFGYNGKIFASSILPGCKEMSQRYGLKSNLYIYGVGDHGGGITRQDIIRANRLNESACLPKFVFAKTVDFFKEIESFGNRFPVIRGEQNTVFEGCYTSHGNIKKANRENEHALVKAETVSSIASAYALAAARNLDAKEAFSPIFEADLALNKELKAAWQTQCFHQFHDIICGCSIHESYDESLLLMAQVKKTADQLSSLSIHNIVRTFSGSAEGGENQTNISITIFNTLSWERNDLIELDIADHPQLADWQTGEILQDSSGLDIVVQRYADKLLFVAEKVPSLGFKTFTHQGRQAVDLAKWTVNRSPRNNPVLINDHYEIEVDQECGTISGLVDRATGRELSHTALGEWVESNETKGLMNLLEIQYEAPHPMSAWKLGTITQIKRLVSGAKVSIGEQGPVMQSIHIVHSVEDAYIVQEIRAYRGVERIDFVTKVDWKGQGTGKTDAPMLKVHFTPKLEETRAAFDIPFGFLERTANGREVPAVHWMDISEKKATNDLAFGMTILNNGKYGHSVQGNTLGLTLIRSSYEPDNRADVGEHSFTYSMLPHALDWQEAHSDRRGWELNQPMAACVHSSKAEDFSAIVVEEFTVNGWITASNVRVTAFKPAENKLASKSWIIRLLETHERSTDIRVKTSFAFSLAEEVDLLEDPIKMIPNLAEGVVSIGRILPGEIRTLRITR